MGADGRFNPSIALIAGLPIVWIRSTMLERLCTVRAVSEKQTGANRGSKFKWDRGSQKLLQLLQKDDPAEWQ
jgi:hypothetical protein